MRLTGLIVVPLLSSSLAIGVNVGWAQTAAPVSAHRDALRETTRPGIPPADLWARRPATQTSEVPAALKSLLPAGLHGTPIEVVNHRQQGPTLTTMPPELSNAPPPKQAITHSKPARVARILTGGETVATATPIASLPYTDSSNTCSFHDDYTPPCGAGGGPDVVYVYSPTANGCIRASLCGSAYDTEIFIAQDSPTNIIACNDDFCGLSSELNGIPVAAGHNYYIIVDGYASSCGDYQLRVDNCPPPPPPVYCPPEAIAEGEPVCSDNYVDNYDGGCNYFPEHFFDLACTTDSIKICGTYGTYPFQGGQYRDTDWYRISINNTTTLHYCVTGQDQTTIFVVDGRSGCGGASILAFGSSTAGATACLDATLSGGTYYLVVLPTNFSGVPCGSNYYMTVVADSCPAPPLPPECPANAMQEGEPVCHDEYVDHYDGGCNSTPEAFVDLACTPGTVQVCGTYGTYLYQGLQYRDTDWYRIVINRTTNIHYCVTGQYATSMYLLDGRSGCGNISLVCGQQGGPSQTVCCNATLSPGTYWLFVGTTQFSGQPCGGVYVMSVTREACPEPFALACPPDARPEGEPVCHDGYVDNFNAGCNSDPPTFSSPYGGGIGNQDCVAGTVRVCGTYGTYNYQGQQYRDTDWYQVVLHGTSHLRYCAVGEAQTTIYVLNGTSGCSGLSLVCNGSGAPGDTICCDQVLSAGTYWLFVATSDFSGVPCGSRYMISVTQDACPEPFRVQCPPGARAEGEPICYDSYLDQTNGGCNSNPPVFTEVPCSDQPSQICGTYGTYHVQGFDYRDTDWYEIEPTEPMHVRFCVIGEAPTVIHILNGNAGCAGITFQCSAVGAAGDTICCEADLLPGPHWFFIAPAGFTGVACGSRYVVTFTGARCTGQTPIAVTVGGVSAQAERGLVQVRWNAFLYAPAEFRVLRAPSAAGEFQQVSDVIPSDGQREFAFEDRSVLPATQYFYRVDYRQYGDWVAAGVAETATSAGEFAIHGITPNPTTGASRIDYELPRAATMRLELFDVGGHRVRVLIEQHLAPAGIASATWDGRNDRGRNLPAGAYYVRLAMNEKVVTHRLVLIR